MALPSAQLGQLPSLNMPGSIPTIQVQKEPKAWEKALLSILAGTASNVLSQGVANSMERENAAEFGATPASGFDKFWHGAAVDDRAATERRTRATEEKKLASTERSNRLDRMQAGTRMNQQATADLNRQALETDRLAADIERGRGMQDIDLERLRSQQAAERVQQLIAEIGKVQQGRVAEADIGLKGAQTKNYEAQAAQQGLQNEMMKSAMQPKTVPGSKPTAALTKFATTGGTQPSVVQPQVDQIASLVQAGVPQDQILAQLQAVNQRQAATQARADQLKVSDEARAARQAAAVAEILRMLTVQPDTTQTMLGP